MTPEEFFAGRPVAAAVFERVRRLLSDPALPDPGCELMVSKSQVALRRRHGFAYLWLPDR